MIASQAPPATLRLSCHPKSTDIVASCTYQDMKRSIVLASRVRVALQAFSCCVPNAALASSVTVLARERLAAPSNGCCQYFPIVFRFELPLAVMTRSHAGMVTGLALAGLPLAVSVSGSCSAAAALCLPCCSITPVYHQASARHVTNIQADSASLSFKRYWLQSASLDAASTMLTA